MKTNEVEKNKILNLAMPMGEKNFKLSIVALYLNVALHNVLRVSPGPTLSQKKLACKSYARAFGTLNFHNFTIEPAFKTF